MKYREHSRLLKNILMTSSFFTVKLFKYSLTVALIFMILKSLEEVNESCNLPPRQPTLLTFTALFLSVAYVVDQSTCLCMLYLVGSIRFNFSLSRVILELICVGSHGYT